MVATLAHAGRAPGNAAPGPSHPRLGTAGELGLLVLPVLVLAIGSLSEHGGSVATYAIGAETALIAATQVAISILVVRSYPRLGVVLSLTPALIAGLVLAIGDVIGLTLVFDRTPRTVTSVLAYDVVLGVLVALPIVVVLRAMAPTTPAGSDNGTPLCPREARKVDDASPEELIESYRRVLTESACRARRLYPRVLHGRALLTHQLLVRHIRQTLEAMQRGYARRAVETGLNEAEARDRKTIEIYLQSVPPISKAVPIPTVASVFVLWKLVPVLVAVAAAIATSIGGGDGRLGGLTTVLEPIADVIPPEIASLCVDALALGIAFSLLMLVLTPAIRRRDKLLACYGVCEREVILMDRRLQKVIRRRSRRLEYVMAALPALPLVLCGVTLLAYALAGLFVYPSPGGPLGDLLERADVMNLGPVTGVAVAQTFLVLAALWIAFIVKTRRTTRVVLL